MQGDGGWVRHRSGDGVDTVGDRENIRCGREHNFGVCAVPSGSEVVVVLAQTELAFATAIAGVAGDQWRNGHQVADVQASDIVTGVDHAAGELMPAYQRHGVRSFDHHATDVGATHSAGLDSDEDVARTGELGAGDVLDSDVSGAVQNSRGHR